jgi:hypothetical protein
MAVRKTRYRKAEVIVTVAPDYGEVSERKVLDIKEHNVEGFGRWRPVAVDDG